MRGTVSEVSATFVASTTRRFGPGLNTRSWSAAESRAYSGRISVSRYCRRDSSRWASRISRSPGRNTSTSPGPPPRLRSATISSSTAAMCSALPCCMRSPVSPTGRQRSSTGYARPSTDTTGAPPKCSAKRAVSMVAEVTMIFSSGRFAASRLR